MSVEATGADQAIGPARPMGAVSWGPVCDLALSVLLIATTFLLGWVELFDPDIWWHVRAGQWIVEHRDVPRLDPFSFASADRVWIDLHWGFQVCMAIAHRLAGVPGLLLAASAACALAVATAVTARRREWPWLVVLWCWPVVILAMSARFDPRPEVLSLIGLAATMAVLLRADREPRWAWALPVIMILWINTHALFILGAVLIGGFVAGAALESSRGRPGRDRRFWVRLAPAAGAAVLSCLLNPYGIRGVLFPLELYAKIGDPANPYKQYIAEFMGPATRVAREGVEAVAGRGYLQALVFLLALLPASFVLPAAWRQARGGSGPTRVWRWVAGAFVAVAAVALSVLVLPGPSVGARWVGVATWIPAALALIALAAAGIIAVRSWRVGLVLGFGGFASALWVDWLRGHVFGRALSISGWNGSGAGLVELAALAVGLVSVFLLIRAGAVPFRLLASVAFVYLGLTADRNANVCALVVGTVLAWNWAEWAGELRAASRPRSFRGFAALARFSLAAVLLTFAGAVVTDRVFPLMGYQLHFGLRERPFTYAHEAARFAGGPGLPDRALGFDMQQTGVYVFHNGPGRKIFMDGRLEVPSLTTFKAYTGLEALLDRGDPRWAGVVKGMGDPLILIDHATHQRAEAAILSNPNWRCIYFDPVASVYLPKSWPDPKGRYPTFDPLQAHLDAGSSAGRARDPMDDFTEARALLSLSSTLGPWPGNPRWGLGAALLAENRLRSTLATRPEWAGAWLLLGHNVRRLPPANLEGTSGLSDQDEDLVALATWQAAYAYHRALEADPANQAARRALEELQNARRPFDVPAGGQSNGNPDRDHHSDGQPGREFGEDARRQARDALFRGNSQAALDARGQVSRAAGATADTFLGHALFAAGEYDNAAAVYTGVLDQDPLHAEAHVGLSLSRFRQGRAREANEAIQAALKLELSPFQRALVESLAALAAPHGRD